MRGWEICEYETLIMKSGRGTIKATYFKRTFFFIIKITYMLIDKMLYETLGAALHALDDVYFAMKLDEK